MGGWHLARSRWANPFVVRRLVDVMDGDERQELSSLTRGQVLEVKRIFDRQERARVLALYEEHVRGEPELLDGLSELTGHTLGCWCVTTRGGEPEVCHGQVLVRLWDEYVAV